VKAVVYSGYGATPVLTQAADPACPADGVVIAVGATGVCRSDWHAWKGHDPVTLPHIGGHEFAGVVVTAGPEVRRWRAGDRVTVPFACGCGRCEHCLAGDAQVCPRQTQPGFTGPGSFAELVAVHAADANLVALPAGLDFLTAACLGCRFATAFRAVTAHGRVRPGDWLAVHGCGGVGLSAVLIGVALGARVLAVDVSAAALARARELGAEAAVDAGVDAGTDGAAATILVSAERAREFTDDPVYVAGFGVATDHPYLHEKTTFTGLPATVKAAERAYAMAGIGPGDIDLAEVHDCFTITEILDIEDLGFCEKGKGGIVSIEGETSLTGRIPVNPSGGLLAKGHPIGASGVAQLTECWWQLRGQADGRQVAIRNGFALQHNVGGRGSGVSVVNVLTTNAS